MYRKDIDGLRAVAIAPVVLYHAGFGVFSGGYVGVDVFFVISGFLITGILKGDVEAGRYSIANFYERRIRRILPAFATVAAVCVVASLLLLLPEDLKDFGTSLWASSLFSSNISFWLDSNNYFQGASDQKPLLHTWSLSVEEQFYIFFPLLLLAMARVKLWRHIKAVCWVGLAASLAISIYGAFYVSMATFYLLPTRAWELLAGSMLALGAFTPPKGRLQAEIESALGLLLIVVPVFVYTHLTFFPGLAAVPPVLGAALIIHAGSGEAKTLVARILSLRAVVFIGLISYSLYLWHWPVIVFTRYYLIETSMLANAGMVVVSVILAILSWRFVERPFRHPAARKLNRGQLFAITVVILGAFAATGLLLARSQGLPGRMPKEIVAMAEKSTYQGPWRECGHAFKKKRTVETLCVLGATGVTPDFLFVGDSHADALAASAFEAAATVGRSGYQITDTGYRPTLGYLKRGEEAKYAHLHRLVEETLARHPQVKDVIVPIYWRQATNIDYYVRSDSPMRMRKGRISVEQGLSALFDKYPNHRFLLVFSTADSMAFGGEAAARAARYGRDYDPVVPWTEFQRARSGYQDIATRLAARANVESFDLSTRMCTPAGCRGVIDGKVAFSDDNHLSYSAARLFHRDFEGFLRRAP